MIVKVLGQSEITVGLLLSKPTEQLLQNLLLLMLTQLIINISLNIAIVFAQSSFLPNASENAKISFKEKAHACYINTGKKT